MNYFYNHDKLIIQRDINAMNIIVFQAQFTAHLAISGNLKLKLYINNILQQTV